MVNEGDEVMDRAETVLSSRTDVLLQPTSEEKSALKGLEIVYASQPRVVRIDPPRLMALTLPLI